MEQDYLAEIQRLEEERESSVSEFENRQQALFDSLVEGVLLLDSNERIQMANRAFTRLFGLVVNVRGKTVLEVLRQHELSELLEKVTLENQVADFELKLTGLTERWVQINAAAIPADDGKKRGTILVFHELTRIKQLERTREEFVANVSHELRTPLSLIKGYVETLLDGAKDNPDVQSKFLSTILRNSERLQFLIEDLLTISELESGRITMNVQPVRLRPLVDRVVEDFRAHASAKSVELMNELSDVEANVDVERFQQVLANLIGNAIKYGRSDGHVKICGRRLDDNTVEISVRDDGPGIPPDSLERVFERFYRVDKARSREQGGTGLGLSIVKHIVQNHGGKVWVQSEPGNGAEFFFTLRTGRFLDHA